MGRKREEVRLRLIWNSVLDNGGNPTKVVERSGLPRRSVYRYLDVLCKENALRRVGHSPANYQPTRAGAELYQSIPAKPCHDSGTTPQNCGTTPMRQGPATPSRALQLKTFQDAPEEAPAGPAPTTPIIPPGLPNIPPEAQDCASLPSIELPEVRPAPPVKLDYPARHHDNIVYLNVLKPGCRTPNPELIHWGPWKEGVHGPWYRQADVLLDFGAVTIQDFGSSIRLFLPERTVETREDLAEILQETTNRALRVSNWLGKQYGIQLSLPEFESSWVAYRVPETQLKGKWSGHFKVQLDDGSWVVFDQSKGYAEIEILVRAAEFSKTLRLLLAWANAPALLNVLSDQVTEMKASMPANIQIHVAASMLKAMPPIALEAVKAPEFQEELRKQFKAAAQDALTYVPSISERKDGYA